MLTARALNRLFTLPLSILLYYLWFKWAVHVCLAHGGTAKPQVCQSCLVLLILLYEPAADANNLAPLSQISSDMRRTERIHEQGKKYVKLTFVILISDHLTVSPNQGAKSLLDPSVREVQLKTGNLAEPAERFFKMRVKTRWMDKKNY